MSEIRIAALNDIAKLSRLSVDLGNVPFLPNQSIVSFFEDATGIADAAVQVAWHAAGSWIREDLRRQGLTYQLRRVLDNEIRLRGIPVYFAVPGNEFEKELFNKYGTAIELTAQMRKI